jgi:hypothetical protein
MAEYTTPADYAAQTSKWRHYLGIENHLQYHEQVKVANAEIAVLQTSDPAKYNEFMSDARAWGAREEKHIAENNEKNAPVTPRPSGRHHGNGDFIALSMSTAGGVLEVAMQHAYETGDVNFGFIISAYSNTKWRYDITCVDYDAGGIDATAFLAKASKDGPVECTVNSEYVARSSSTGLSYRKKGSCKISCAFDSNTNVKASESPQYDDGKERVPVHYTV